MGTDKVPDLIDLAHRLATNFEKVVIPYFIGGSVASSLMSEYRFTNDIDIIIDLSPEQLKPLLNTLGDEFYYGAEAARQAVESAGSFNLIHIPTAQKIDLFVMKKTAFDQEQMKRRRMLEVRDDIRLYVATAEDTLLSKLRWFKLGGEASDQQWRDIKGLIRVQGSLLDIQYLEKWADNLGVYDLLKKALN